MAEILLWLFTKVLNVVFNFLLTLAWRKLVEWRQRRCIESRVERHDDTPAG